MAYRDEVLLDGPAGYWRFEETSGSTVADETANEHDGTVTGANLDVSGPDANLGSAARFDGTDDFVEVPNHASLTGFDDFTVELWLRILDFGEVDYIFGVYETGGNAAWAVLTHDTASALRLSLVDDENTFITHNQIHRDDVNDGEWHHVVFTRSGTTVTAYLDGVSEGTSTFTANSLQSNTPPLTIGSRWGGSGGTAFANAEVDECAVYDHALSAARVTAHNEAAFEDPVPAPSITTTSLPDATEGVPYSETLEATGGTPPYEWAIVSGSLPDGLTLAPSTGDISGTPTETGTFAFTVQVTDDAEETDTQALSIEADEPSDILPIEWPCPLVARLDPTHMEAVVEETQMHADVDPTHLLTRTDCDE